MFDKPVSWGELITVVLFVLGSALIFYLILVAANLVRVLKNVNKIIEKNAEPINKTIIKLPQISENAEKITGSLKNNMETIEKVVTDVGKVSESVKKGVETFQKDILGKAKVFVDIVEAVKKLFEKKKDTPPKKKGTVYKYKYRKGQETPEEVEIVATDKVDDEPYTGYEQVAEAGKADEAGSADQGKE